MEVISQIYDKYKNMNHEKLTPNDVYPMIESLLADEK